MRSAFFGFHVASTALFTARANLNVVSHNIANAEIPGFSRQVVQARAAAPLNLRDGRGMYGTGSQVTGIIQMRNQFLDTKFWGQSSVRGRHTAVNTHLTFVETVFNNLPNAGVLRTFNDFFSRLQDFSTRPEDPTFRTNVITQADSMAEMVRHHAQTLQRQQRDINREVSDTVNQINSLGSQIASLNTQITAFERTGNNANDLRDQRALLIDHLSELVNITVEERDYSTPMNPDDRRLNIMINGYGFVSHTNVQRLEVVARTDAQRRNEMDVPGLYDVIFASTGERFNIHSTSLGGTLRGLIDVRDGNNTVITEPLIVRQWPAGFDPHNPNAWQGSWISWPPAFDPLNPDLWTGGWPANMNANTFDPRQQSTWPTGAELIPQPPATVAPPLVPSDPSNPSVPAIPMPTPPAINVPGFAIGPSDPPVAYSWPFGTVTGPGTTTNFKGIPFYMNQLNELVRTFARAMNEGRNATGDRIPGTTGHIHGYNGNNPPENLGTMFFTFADPNDPQGGQMQRDDLRLWILADANNNPLRNPDGTFQTIRSASPPGTPGTGIQVVHPDGVTGLVDIATLTPYRDSDNGLEVFTLDYSRMNALNFALNRDLDGDPMLLAASSSGTVGQSNNDVISGFIAIGHDRSLFREGRLADFIIATSGHLAVDTNQAQRFQVSYEEITTQTHNHRLSVKGVSIDEEMMNLVRFQTMFTAASRLVNVMDSIYDTLINRLGN